MPVEGRDLSSRQTQQVMRDLEIGQPINSEQCSEIADGVTRKSEGRTRLSLLRPLRQDQPRGHSGARLCPVPLQQGRTGSGRSGLCSVTTIKMAARIAAPENVPEPTSVASPCLLPLPHRSPPECELLFPLFDISCLLLWGRASSRKATWLRSKDLREKALTQ